YFFLCSPRGSSAGDSDSSGCSSWELVELECYDEGQGPDLPVSALQSADETARFGCWPFGLLVWSLFSLVSDPIVEQDSADEVEGLELQMPVEPWSRRFYRQSATDGVEVQLVRRKSGNVWAVIGPDLTLGLICITAKTSIFADPVAGIRRRPMPPLSAAQRDAYVSQATEGLKASTVPTWPLYRPGKGGQQAIAVNVLYAVFSSGASSLKTLRWSLRSPKRFLGVLAALFVLYELLVLLGVIEYMKEVWVYTISYLVTAKDAFVESSEVVQEWATYLWEWKEWTQKLMPLQRWFAMFLSLILLTIWAAHEWSDSVEYGESSIGSSSASSVDVPVAATASVPPPLPPPGYLSSGESAALASQLNDLAESQKAMMEEISEIRTAERTRELRRDVLEASLDSCGRADAEANKQVIEGMIARLDQFEARLKGEAPAEAGAGEHGAAIEGASSSASAVAVPGSPTKSAPTALMETPEKRAATSQPEAVELAIKRMRFKAQLPQQVFMEQLDEYREIEPEEWNGRMPEGYGQISAEVLSEIYSSGKTAEAWARDFIRDRGLSDCNTAREMIAAFAAVDTMLMTDRQRGLLNLVSFERLVRKGYAIVRAYRNVNSRDDWSRPKDAKNWKSKVDWEAARRLDPQLADESTIRVMSAEEEMKKAMGRDAQLTKARSDLDGGAAVLSARPERPASTSRRALSRWKEEMELAETANRSLLALRQLYRGSLDDSLLGLADCWGQGVAPDNLDGVDEVGLFCAVKKAELVGSEPGVTRRLVFDQRRSNMRWRSPPWCAMGGASAMSFLDVSEEMKEDGVTMCFGTGDLPDFYFTLELREELAPYFVLPGVSGDAVDALLPEGSSLPGSGPYVGVKVALMGFSWACWMAQTTMEYIDDFGIMGLDFPTRPGQEAATTVEEIWLGAKELVVSAGFKVHKDTCAADARMIGGDLRGTRLAPNQDKMWLTVFGIREILIHKWELPDTVARIVGILFWGFLICRGALSVFAVPREVLRELAAAAALAPLISVDLSTPWDPMAMMFDAGLYGGALISTVATVEEQTDELVLPEKVASRIEALADLAEVDPFQPLRMGVSIPVKVLRFAHLCSGHTRIGDLEDWLLRIAGSRGYLMICTSVDIGPGAEFDLTDEVNVRRPFMLYLVAGSLPAWRPPPLRLRDQLRGRPGLRGDDAKKVKLGNAQLLSSLRILKAIGLKGGSVSIEHPADPGCPPFPSIFVTKELVDWEARVGAYRVTFPQCMRGCPALKLTTLTGTAFGMQRFVRPCVRENHSASLCGKDESGRCWTRVAQACPSDFCRMLAECHVDAMLTTHERREADLTERAVEQLISETLERRPVQDYVGMMQDLHDWAQQWFGDLTQRATDGTEWQEWCVAFLTDVLLSGPNQKRLRGRDSGYNRNTGRSWKIFVRCFGFDLVTRRLTIDDRLVSGSPTWMMSSRRPGPLAGPVARGGPCSWVRPLLPFLSDAVGEERLRRHAQHRKMGNTHRRNDAEGAHPQGVPRRERTTYGLALLPFSVSTKTALGCYVPNVRRFLNFALEVNLPMMSREEIDDSVLCYLDRLVEDEEVGPHRGDFVVHGLAYVWPELSTGLPRSNRALRAWHRLHVAGEGGPQPLELWAVLDEAMRLAGSVEAADAAEVALDAYLRSAELFALRAADIVVDVDEAGEQIVALRLGVTERGERTKTGVRQGVLIDRRHVSDMLVRRKSERDPSDRVFSCSVDAYRRALRRACDDVGVEHFPPHAARHSGPSHDAATGYRTAWAIQRRGRWASEKSVLRYMKTHALVAARAALPPDILERG
ncbi:unnamed protein product, partial [Prorocentrum cordatum]